MFSLCTFFPTMTLNLNSDLRPWPMYLTLMWSSWTTLQVSMSKSILMEAYRSAQRDRQTDRQTQLTDCITRLLQRSVQSNAKDLCTIHWWISKANYYRKQTTDSRAIIIISSSSSSLDASLTTIILHGCTKIWVTVSTKRSRYVFGRSFSKH